ncbi:MAG: AI-2E family transporter [Beijerinckiaceae bacterium]|nr:AI-2E family transporter [Beijerinckiaceae bacterium]
MKRNAAIDIPVTPPAVKARSETGQTIFWLVLVSGLAALLFLFKSVALPFIAGLFLAYLLDPLATRLQRLGIGRLGASLFILTVFIVVVSSALVFALPQLASQMTSLLEKLPGYASRLQTLAIEQGGPLLEKYGGQSALLDFEKSLGNLVGQLVNYVGSFIASLWSGGQAIIGAFSILIVTPVVTFYLLVDWPDLIHAVDGWVPIKNRNTVRAIAGDINRAIAGFLWGQGVVCLFLATFYGIGLSLAQLNFGLLIGLMTGLLSFIPYVGTLTGLVLAMAVAIAQFWPDSTSIVLVLGIFLAGQFLEGYILSPKLVGESVGLHPVWLMFALFAFGSLFGFVGLLFAVPLAAAAGVLARFALSQYLASSLYRGVAIDEVGAGRDG